MAWVDPVSCVVHVCFRRQNVVTLYGLKEFWQNGKLANSPSQNTTLILITVRLYQATCFGFT